MYIAEHDINGLANFCFSCVALNEVFIRTRTIVREKRNNAGTHRNADCPLKNTSIKDGKYVVNENIYIHRPFFDF